MATVGQLKTRISLYLQKPVKDFSQDGENLILVELNNARRHAESAHDWHCEERLLSLSVAPTTGGDLTSAPELSTGEVVKVTDQYYLSVDAGLVPLLHVDKKRVSNDYRKELKRTSFDTTTRWRGDTGDSSRAINNNPKVYQQNNVVFLEPDVTVSTAIKCDSYVWLSDYSKDSDSDWFTTYGADYLQWYCVVALNYLTGTFSPRQEGVMPPPEKAKKDAYDKMFTMDRHQYVKGSVPFV
jgi:hypothetical protein